MSALLLLRAVPAASLLAVLHALGVERAADDLVADAGEVLHPAAADEHDRVLLEVVADARDVGRDLDATAQAHAGDLAEGGVRLLRGGRVDARADAASLGRTLQGRRLVLRHLVLAALADQLVDGGHLGGSLSGLSSRPGTLPGTGVVRCFSCRSIRPAAHERVRCCGARSRGLAGPDTEDRDYRGRVRGSKHRAPAPRPARPAARRPGSTTGTPAPPPRRPRAPVRRRSPASSAPPGARRSSRSPGSRAAYRP